MPDEIVDCCICSPPYWNLRSYDAPEEEFSDGFKGQLGLEPSFELYLDHLLEIFDQVKRVLKKAGTCWVNIGSSYMSHDYFQVKEEWYG